MRLADAGVGIRLDFEQALSLDSYLDIRDGLMNMKGGQN